LIWQFNDLKILKEMSFELEKSQRNQPFGLEEISTNENPLENSD